MVSPSTFDTWCRRMQQVAPAFGVWKIGPPGAWGSGSTPRAASLGERRARRVGHPARLDRRAPEPHRTSGRLLRRAGGQHATPSPPLCRWGSPSHRCTTAGPSRWSRRTFRPQQASQSAASNRLTQTAPVGVSPTDPPGLRLPPSRSSTPIRRTTPASSNASMMSATSVVSLRSTLSSSMWELSAPSTIRVAVAPMSSTGNAACDP